MMMKRELILNKLLRMWAENNAYNAFPSGENIKKNHILIMHVFPSTQVHVKEFGEGVDRMYREMEDAGLPDPEYHVSSFMLCATLKNQKWVTTHQQAGHVTPQAVPQVTPQVAPQVDLATEKKILEFCSVPRSRTELLEHLNLSDRKNLRTKYLNPLLASGKLKMTLPDKPNSPLQKYVKG